MSYKSTGNIAQESDEIDLIELWEILWAERLLIASVTLLFAIIALIYSFLQIEIYRSEAVLAPVESRQSNNALVTQLGAAAGLVGINVGNENSNRVTTAIATMQSREFIKRFIERHELLVPLMAGKWSKSERMNVIDSEIYDEQSLSWVAEPPSDLEAYKKFDEMLSVSENQVNGLVTVSAEWHDPEQAKLWLNWVIADINALVKAQDLEEATNAIEYLTQQLESTQLVEMQRAFFQLIESQTRIVMLADVRDDYVFRIVDPAFLPEEKVRPRRALIFVLGVVLGLMFSFMLVFVRRAQRHHSTSRDSASGSA